MITVQEMLTPVKVLVNLTDGSIAEVTTDARWASKMENVTVCAFERHGEWILFIRKDGKGNIIDNGDKTGMTVPHFLTGKCSQYHYRDNNPFNCTTSNFRSPHEKHTNKKFK